MPDSSRPATVWVIADHTPGPHRTDSDDIGWWLPVIGPTATVLAHRLAREAVRVEICWAVDELARLVGF